MPTRNAIAAFSKQCMRIAKLVHNYMECCYST